MLKNITLSAHTSFKIQAKKILYRNIELNATPTCAIYSSRPLQL